MTERKTPRSKVIELTPELARKFLENQAPNRVLNPRIVTRHASSILRGEWELSNDALALDDEGRLVNGQHRCYAVIQADRAIPVVLVEGVRDETQEVIDTGRSRQLHDVLAIRGDKNTTTLASACGWLWRMEHGAMRSAGHNSPTHRQLLEVLDEHPDLRNACHDVRVLRNSLRLSTGLFGMLLYVFATIDSEDCDAFAIKLSTGADLHEDDPVLRLRTLLLAEVGALRKTQPWKIAALTIKAWNMYRDGETTRQLRFRAGGAAPEDFPIPH